MSVVEPVAAYQAYWDAYLWKCVGFAVVLMGAFLVAQFFVIKLAIESAYRGGM
jgi:hypothetical protein